MAAPAQTSRQPQTTTRPHLTPFTLPTSRHLSRNVHTPMAADPWLIPHARPHINQGLRQAGHSGSVADKLSRAVSLLAAQGVPQITQSAGPEPGARGARATGLSYGAPLPSPPPRTDGQGNSSGAGTIGGTKAELEVEGVGTCRLEDQDVDVAGGHKRRWVPARAQKWPHHHLPNQIRMGSSEPRS